MFVLPLQNPTFPTDIRKSSSKVTSLIVSLAFKDTSAPLTSELSVALGNEPLSVSSRSTLSGSEFSVSYILSPFYNSCFPESFGFFDILPRQFWLLTLLPHLLNAIVMSRFQGTILGNKTGPRYFGSHCHRCVLSYISPIFCPFPQSNILKIHSHIYFLSPIHTTQLVPKISFGGRQFPPAVGIKVLHSGCPGIWPLAPPGKANTPLNAV